MSNPVTFCPWGVAWQELHSRTREWMDLTSRSIWDKKKRKNYYFYFALLPFFFLQSKMRTEHHICLLLAINYFPEFLLHSTFFFSNFFILWNFIFSLPFQYANAFAALWSFPLVQSSPLSLYKVSVLILPVDRCDSWKLQHWFALGHHWMGWAVWGIFCMVLISLVRNKSPWLQVSPMKLVPIKTFTLTKECVIFLLWLCKRKSTSSLDTSRKEIISQKNASIFRDDLWAGVFLLMNTQPWSPLESDFFTLLVVDKCFTIIIKSTAHEGTSEILDIYWTEATLHIHFCNDSWLSHRLMDGNWVFLRYNFNVLQLWKSAVSYSQI